MASVIEIIKIITSLIPTYDGNGEKLESIVAALNAYKPLITDGNKQTAFNTILSRLEGKARPAVGDNPQAVDEIIQKLNEKCKGTIAPETVEAKLNATKQSGEVTKFTQEIEKLTLELERAYINEHVPVDTASRMAVKAGVKALFSGIRNEETKILLKAGQFTSLSSAIEKITENEPSASCKVFQVRTNNSGNNRYPRYTNSQFRGNSRGNFNSHMNFQGYSRGQAYSRGRGNFRGHRYQRNFHQQSTRGNNRGHFNNNTPRIYYNTSNLQDQQHPAGQVTLTNQQTSLGFRQPFQPQQHQQQSNQVALTQLVPRA
ncbi:uncharacterized protein LOC134225994 [Armigeres subalbatus]|uniref:uncharacterized protein LOC134225994 n=1 Tax=Armigeres subalbatus TaxID=124917 RepID=UPI002ECFCC46